MLQVPYIFPVKIRHRIEVAEFMNWCAVCLLLSLGSVLIFSSFCWCRERPKYQIKDDGENVRNGFKAFAEGSDTVKVTREPRKDETVRARWAESLSHIL